MGNPVLLLWVLILVFNFSTISNVQTADTSLEDHVKKIDEVLAEMQSHSQAQEQKYSAILSNLLSQLKQTEHELGDLKKSLNETTLELEGKKVEISELWKNHNATVLELDELRAETRSNLQYLEKRADLNGNIGFHAKLSLNKNVTANTPIIFDLVLNDMGASYNRHTGEFIVPMNGTYQIWIDLTYRRSGSYLVFHIYNDNDIIDNAYGSNYDTKESASTFTMHYLQQGESIWITSTKDVYLYKSYCNFGAVLLNAH